MPLDLKNPALAINGGTPVRSAAWQDNLTFGEEEKQAVIAAIESGYLSKFEGSFTPDPPMSFWGGPFVQKLEEDWNAFYGSRFAISMNSATSGLFAALGALGVGYGDEVIVSPSTMTASSIGPLIYGAIPIFADIEPLTGAIDCDSVESLINERTRAIVVVHQYGIPADMERLVAMCKPRGIAIIEDCAQSHAAKIGDKYVGLFGDIGVFSLNVNKSIQSGEGGVCITDNEDLRYRLALIRNHAEAVVGPAGVGDITNLIGYNYRLTEIQAAVAIEQLRKLPEINRIRMGYVDYLNQELSKFDFLEIMPGRAGCTSTFYTYPIRVRPQVAGCDAHELRKILNAEGMYWLSGYKPLYNQPAYQQKKVFKHGYPFTAPENKDIQTNYHQGACPVAEQMHNEILIKEYVRAPNTMEDMQDIVKAFARVAGSAAHG